MCLHRIDFIVSPSFLLETDVIKCVILQKKIDSNLFALRKTFRDSRRGISSNS